MQAEVEWRANLEEAKWAAEQCASPRVGRDQVCTPRARHPRRVAACGQLDWIQCERRWTLLLSLAGAVEVPINQGDLQRRWACRRNCPPPRLTPTHSSPDALGGGRRWRKPEHSPGTIATE